MARTLKESRFRDLEKDAMEANPREVLRQYLENSTGQVIGKELTVVQLMELLTKVRFTHNHVLVNAHIGMAALQWNALRGNCRAGQALLDRYLGTPDQPFEEKVSEMNLDQAKIQLYLALRDSGANPTKAKEMVVKLGKQEFKKEEMRADWLEI